MLSDVFVIKFAFELCHVSRVSCATQIFSFRHARLTYLQQLKKPRYLRMDLDILSLSRATNNTETDAPFLFYWKL